MERRFFIGTTFEPTATALATDTLTRVSRGLVSLSELFAGTPTPRSEASIVPRRGRTPAKTLDFRRSREEFDAVREYVNGSTHWVQRRRTRMSARPVTTLSGAS